MHIKVKEISLLTSFYSVLVLLFLCGRSKFAKCNCRKIVNFTLITMVSFQFSQNLVATKLAIISNLKKKTKKQKRKKKTKKKKKNVAAKCTCLTVNGENKVTIIYSKGYNTKYFDLV